MAAPPTRGWTVTTSGETRKVAGCPAYAGMDLCNLRCALCLRGLPRLRGDGPFRSRREANDFWAAPPTRGWTQKSRSGNWPARGCPAYAGMDPPRWATHRGRDRLPRLRGDGPYVPHLAHPHPQAAPPTRGWTSKWPVVPASSTGCPAYAGMDPRPTLSYQKNRRLPRLRGDGPHPRQARG